MAGELLLCVGGPVDGQYMRGAGDALRVSKNVSPQLLAAGELPYEDYKRMELQVEGQPFALWVPTHYTHYRLMMELMQGYKPRSERVAA